MKNVKSILVFTSGLVIGFVLLQLLLEGKASIKVYVNVEESFLRMEDHGGENMAANSTNTSRILCWIMTGPKNLDSRTRHIRATWAHRCDTTLYMSSVESAFPTVGLNVTEGRKNLSWKTIRAFQYIHQNYLNQAEWFLKADDDVFVVVENLRFILSKLNTEEPWYLGRRFSPFLKQGYMSGGAGYVLSREALRRFFKCFETGACTNFSTDEDVTMGKCMEKVGVQPGDTRDVFGRQTFHAFPPNKYIIRQQKRSRPWYSLYDTYPFFEGPGCCSDYSVSFHYIHGVQLYFLQYVTYHLRPYGYKYRLKPERFQNNSTKRLK